MTWLKSLLEELQVHLNSSPTIWCDKPGAIDMPKDPMLHARIKHIELDLYFVREKVMQGTMLVKHIPAQDQSADILTKAISSFKFYELRNKLRIESLST